MHSADLPWDHGLLDVRLVIVTTAHAHDIVLDKSRKTAAEKYTAAHRVIQLFSALYSGALQRDCSLPRVHVNELNHDVRVSAV